MNGKLGTVTHCGIGIWSSGNEEVEAFEYADRIESISNNEAEYEALIKGIEICIEKGIKEVEFYLDSQIVVYGATKGKATGNERMDRYKGKIALLKWRFDKISFTWIPREENSKADFLSKKYLFN